MHEHKAMVPIWFFIGLLLLAYGIIILFSDLLGIGRVAGSHVVLEELHAGTWWGLLLLIIGLVYTVKYRPKRGK